MLDWIRRKPAAAAVLGELLRELDYLQRSRRHTTALRADLESFIANFPRLEHWTATVITGYLAGRHVGARRRDNIRDAIVQLSRFARKRGYLPEGAKSEAEKVPKIKPGHDIVTWTPEEADLLLEHVSFHWLPCEAIGLFAGLRKSEILRLDWSAFKWEQSVIAVMRKVAKKIRVDRLVPIQPNLASWLEPYRHRVGPLYPGNFKTNENAHSAEMKRIRRRTGLPRKDNANRHSFGSYRLAIVKSYQQVALEMGNSERKVRENYNDPKTEAEARAYFGINGHDLANVIPLALPLEFR